ncbi:MAG: hypothetical protein ABI977_25005 [Acidobacteriota bacterium]
MKTLKMISSLMATFLLCGSLSQGRLAQQELPNPTAAQPDQPNQEDKARLLWNKRFEAARAKADAPSSVDGELIGVTIWRLRPSTPNEEQKDARLLIRKSGGNSKLIPERVTSSASFGESEQVRLSVESPRNGFLYVIDREVYADGKLGDPYLIFPTRTTRGGDNTLTAGKVIDVPALSDQIPYFTLTRSRQDHTTEMLTLIVSPAKLDLPLGNEPVKLDAAQLAQWEKQWGGKVEAREAPQSAGSAWTTAEKEAAEGTRQLTQGDPLPQTIYKVAVKPGAALLLNIPLRIKP